MLQFVISGVTPALAVEQVKEVIEGGAQWIQLNPGSFTDEELRNIINEIKPICENADVFLVIGSRIDLCKEFGLSGVHLTKNDLLPSKARLELGAGPIIGVTANNIEDVISVRSLDVDYICLEPFHSNNEKSLEVDGLKEIMSKMQELEIEIPTVAGTGIKTEDVDAIMETGVRGIAVSKAIADSDNLVNKTREFIKLLEPFDKSGE